MTFTDSPDWQEVAVTVAAAGDMPDAPDWQRTVVGPGAVPIGGASFPATVEFAAAPTQTLSGSGSFATINSAYTGSGYQLYLWYLWVLFTAASVGDHLVLSVGPANSPPSQTYGQAGARIEQQTTGVSGYYSVGGSVWVKASDNVPDQFAVFYTVSGAPTTCQVSAFDDSGYNCGSWVLSP